MRLTGYLTVVFLSLGVAGYAMVVYGFIPLGAVVHPDMRATFEAQRVGIHTHIFAGLVALVIGPFQFLDAVRSTRPALHRWLGRLYLGIGGLAGLYMAFHAFGGLASRLGFGCLALAWLYTGWRAYAAIRERDIGLHQRWMVHNFALTFAPVTLRLWVPGSVAAGLPFELVYSVVAWLCWVPNVVVAEWLLVRGVFQVRTSPS